MIEEIHEAGIEHLKKVVGLRNRPAPECNGAEPSVIEAIEELLARARRGEIVAIAATVVEPNGDAGTLVRNPSGHRHRLVAAVTYLLHDMCSEKE